MAGMTEPMVVQVYLCSNCLLAGDSPGPCPRCGRLRLTCRPGDADDPCRRPLIDSAGAVRTRAPLWWLTQSVGPLMQRMNLGTKADR
jgi:hypothetical protein